MKAHVIENGKVVNTIEVDDLDFMPNLVDASLGGKIGDTYDGSNFTTPDPMVEVPESVPALNAMLAIDAAGLSTSFQAWANSADRTFAERAFLDKADRWRRSSDVVASGAAALNLTDEQVDNLFIAADQLDP